MKILCYSNVGGSEYEGLVFTNDKQGCISDYRCENGTFEAKEYLSNKLIATNISYKSGRDYCFSSEDDCIAKINGNRCNEDN